MATESVTAEGLFARHFWPYYPPDVRADPAHFRDLDANPAGNPALARTLADAAKVFVDNAPALLGAPVTLDDAGVAVLARSLTRARRDAWLAEPGADGPEGTLFNAVVHASAFLGEVIVRAHGGAWSMRRPMWESVVKRPRGGAVAPFHWLLKSLADDAIDDAPLAYRWHVHVVMANASPESLDRVTEAKRLPTLKAPTYDLLVKYLHQHLPTLRDVGEGFPTAAEFTAKRYASLGFEPLHGGRVLALHGQAPPQDEGAPSTVEVTWVTAAGYDHADVIPADAGVPYFARAVTDEMLEVTVAWKGRPVTHRLTFRGHA
ncbi:MAG: hypothetical protein U0324_35265 [Polyangiales bacterium]